MIGKFTQGALLLVLACVKLFTEGTVLLVLILSSHLLREHFACACFCCLCLLASSYILREPSCLSRLRQAIYSGSTLASACLRQAICLGNTLED